MNIDKFYNNLIKEETDHFFKKFEDEILDEMAYPSNFNLDEFKSLESFNKKIQYCKNLLPYIGGGSSRMVFKIDNDKCLKLAKNKKGLAQNSVEIDLSLQQYYSVIARVYDYDEDNYAWLEMQLVDKLTKPKFKQIIGVTFDDYCQYIRYYGLNVLGNGRMTTSIPDNIKEWGESNEFVEEIVHIMGDYSMAWGDLVRGSSYGVTSDNRVVLVDFGATDDVLDTHYSR